MSSDDELQHTNVPSFVSGPLEQAPVRYWVCTVRWQNNNCCLRPTAQDYLHPTLLCAPYHCTRTLCLPHLPCEVGPVSSHCPGVPTIVAYGRVPRMRCRHTSRRDIARRPSASADDTQPRVSTVDRWLMASPTASDTGCGERHPAVAARRGTVGSMLCAPLWCRASRVECKMCMPCHSRITSIHVDEP